MRRYPGLRWTVLDDRRSGSVALECEYGVGECSPEIARDFVLAWAEVIARAR